MLRRGPFVVRCIGFAALCLWASSAWIWSEAFPPRMGNVAAQGLHLLLIGLATTIFCLIQRSPRPRLLSPVAGGLALLAVPVLLLDASRSMVSLSLAVVVFSLLPVVLTVATGSMQWLFAALLGTAGVLVLLPISLPQTGRGFLGLALMTGAMLSTAAAILWLHRKPFNPWGVAVIALSNGSILTVFGRADPGWTMSTVAYEALRCLLFTAPETLLLLWLIAVLEPRRLAARWLIAPLFTVIEGLVLLHPAIDARLLAGLSLLTAGGLWLFAGRDTEQKDTRSLSIR